MNYSPEACIYLPTLLPQASGALFVYVFDIVFYFKIKSLFNSKSESTNNDIQQKLLKAYMPFNLYLAHLY